MARNWLFGPGARTVNGVLTLRSQTLYVEHVEHVVRYVAEHQPDRVAADAQQRANGRSYGVMLDEPRLQIQVRDIGPISTARDISVDDLGTISEFERRHLTLGAHGASASVTFEVGAQPFVYSIDPNEQTYLIRYLAGVGVPRVPWKRALFVLPISVAVLLVVLWGIDAARAPFGPQAALLGLLSLLGAGVLFVLTRWVWRRYQYWSPGHRIRSSTLAAYRDRLANVRATALVTAIATPAGAALGALVTLWIKG